MSKNSDQRRDEITKLVISKGKIRIDELVSRMKVTAETIRSDLTFLETKGVLYRTHGGATSRNAKIDIPMDIRLKEQMEVKRQICVQAINYVKDDDIIFIDPSSTAVPLGRLLCLRKNLTIVTNSLELVPILSESEHKIIILGGIYSRPGKRTHGGYCLEMLENMYFDVAFMGMDGCKDIDGPSTSSEEETYLNKVVLRRCKKNILLADSSKFDKHANFQYAKFKDFDLIITSKLDDTIKNTIPVDVIESTQE